MDDQQEHARVRKDNPESSQAEVTSADPLSDQTLNDYLQSWRKAKERIANSPSSSEAEERWLWNVASGVLGTLQRRTTHPEIRDVLGFVAESLNEALDGLPIRALCNPGGNHPTTTMRFARAEAVAYARLTKKKHIHDPDWQATICEAYGISLGP
jgi:hypothetical protein